MRKSSTVVGILCAGFVLAALLISCAGGAEEAQFFEDETYRTEEKTAEDIPAVSEDADTRGADSESADFEGTEDTAEAESPDTAVADTTEATPKAAETGARAAELGTEEEAVEFIDEMGESEAPGDGTPSGLAVDESDRSRPASGAPGASGLKAGYADDNKQYGYFLRFLEEYGDVSHIPIPVQERIAVQVTDRDGKSIPNAQVVVSGEGTLSRGKTLADGSFLFFPSLFWQQDSTYTLTVQVMQEMQSIEFDREGRRSVEVSFPFQRRLPSSIPLDILFILDTTGSMGEEIERLKTTIELIHLNLTNLSSHPEVRFGMVLYKDVGDEYVTQVVPLTADLQEFRDALNLVQATGGGDTPEDLQAALEAAMVEIEWNTQGIRLAFVITDAPPHLDYGQQFTYRDAASKGKEEGIKIFTVGTGGLEIQGEYILRQISQFTSGRYIFLTYGETGESEGGAPGSVSHHTGSNFQTDKLEAIIIRFAKEELSYLTDKPIVFEEPYFEARKIPAEKREETLEKLFSMAMAQLADYAAFPISKQTPLAVLPVEPAEPSLSLNGEYFTEQLILTIARSGDFTLVERQDMQSIMEELKVQLSGITDEETVAKVGKLLNAEALVAGKLYAKQDSFELFLRLLRVETGEVLSVTRAAIQRELGL